MNQKELINNELQRMHLILFNQNKDSAVQRWAMDQIENIHSIYIENDLVDFEEEEIIGH